MWRQEFSKDIVFVLSSSSCSAVSRVLEQHGSFSSSQAACARVVTQSWELLMKSFTADDCWSLCICFLNVIQQKELFSFGALQIALSKVSPKLIILDLMYKYVLVALLLDQQQQS